MNQRCLKEAFVAGNYFDKYRSRNPVVQWMVGSFKRCFFALVKDGGTEKTIFEIGCGEGELSIELAKRGYDVVGIDISPEVIEQASQRAEKEQLSIRFVTKDILELENERENHPLVVCCEVLEHLEDPDRALRIISRNCSGYAVLSVPSEPVWSLLNMIRGKYWSRWGNTPGHVQRWRPGEFVRLVEGYLDVVRIERPFPWTMVLCRKRKEDSASL